MVRILLCLVGAAGAMTLVFTAAFAVATADEMSSVSEVVGVGAMLLAFWAPVWCWQAWYVSVPAVLVIGLAAAFFTHRYRLVAVRGSRLLRRIATALVLIVGCWTLVLGVIALSYSI